MHWLKRIIEFLPHRLIAVLAISGLMAGLVTTRVVLSVASITIACNALLHPNAGAHFSAWFKSPQKMLFAGLFLVYLVSGFYSDDMGQWWSNTQNKLPLLAIPFGFTYVETRFKGWKYLWLFIFISIMLISASGVMLNFILNYDSIAESIKMGNAIPTPMNDHIRFSTSLSFSILSGIWLLSKKEIRSQPFARYYLVIALLIQVIILHFLAVRSGIIFLYAGITLYIIHLIVKRGNLITGLSILMLVIAGFIVAVNFIQPLKNKYSYFKYEWELIMTGDYKAGHSDAQRVLSTIYGLEVARENLPLGTGTGDIRQEMEKQYHQHPISVNTKSELPHNQFVYMFAATGIAGLLLLIAAFFYPVSVHKWRSKWLMQCFLIILFISFMSEHALQIQIGITFAMLFSCLLPIILKPSRL